MNTLPNSNEVGEPEGKEDEEIQKDKLTLDDSGDEAFLMSEFYYYTQYYLTLKGVYFQK